jgi:hypothetical protein
MKRLKSILLALPFVIASVTTASSQSYKVGVNVINAGIGFGYSIGYVANSTATPVLSASFEHGFRDVGPGTLGLGGIISHQSATYKDENILGTYRQHWDATYIGFRATWHPDILVTGTYDVYGALQLGYVNYGYSFSGTGLYENAASNYKSSLSSGAGLGLIVGGRYYFSDKIGAFAELGYDLSYLKLGASFAF